MPDSGITATQGVSNVKNCATVALQGTVNIAVAASDALAGLASQPTVNVVNGTTTNAATYVNEGPAGTFNYTWTVDSATPNGTWTATVTATDKADNQTVRTFTLCVNKNQISGEVELHGVSAAVSRIVTFVATGGTSTKTWTPTLSFVGGKASYTLTDVPAGTTGLSAKTAWTLRRKLAVTLDGNGQATVNFTGTNKQKSGDINGSNSINILDYSILKVNWFSTTAPAADINGDGTVNNGDYALMKQNWFQVGDPQ
jgi:hypothetical protein